MFFKKLSIPPLEEDIEGQLDRLNTAVQNLMMGIELSAQTPRNPSQLSLSFRDWGEEKEEEAESAESQEEHLPNDFENKLEEILLSLDRSQMMVEDFWSEAFHKQSEPNSSENEAYIAKLEKENMQLRAKTVPNRENFSLNLKKNSQLDGEKKNFEEKLMQLDKLNEMYHQKNQQILKVQESLKVKEKWLDHKEKELRTCWQKFEKTKQEWETNKEQVSPQKKSPSPTGFYNRLVLKPESFQISPSIIAPQTPSSRQRTFETCQEELKCLESQLECQKSPEEASKLVMKIDQLKNKIATLRGQKALYESNRSSRLISNMMKTMEKEVNYEENKRKQQLERFTKKNAVPKNEEIVKTTNFEAVRRFNFVENSTPRNSAKILQKNTDEKQVLNLIRENLLKKEKEINQRELLLQETWMKIPGSKELIEIVNLTLSKLTEQKQELDNERENFEKEKIELFKLRDKVINSMNKSSIDIN